MQVLESRRVLHSRIMYVQSCPAVILAHDMSVSVRPGPFPFGADILVGFCIFCGAVLGGPSLKTSQGSAFDPPVQSSWTLPRPPPLAFVTVSTIGFTTTI